MNRSDHVFEIIARVARTAVTELHPGAEPVAVPGIDSAKAVGRLLELEDHLDTEVPDDSPAP